jgi:hypothetical protein
LGQSTIYTASVQGTPSGAGNPSGSVTITDNGTAIGVCTNLTSLSTANPAVVSCTVPYNGSGGQGGGAHSIVASYTASGTPAVFANSVSNPITVTVNQASTSIGPLTTTPAITPVYNNGGTAPTIGIPFSFGNTPPPAPSQQFQVYDGTTLIGNLAVPASSPASFSLPLSVYQTVGAHSFTVKYPSGDPNYATQTSAAVAFSVTKFAPMVSPSGFSGSPVTFGNAVTVGGSVNVPNTAGTNAAPASGTLTFTFGTTTLGTCTLVAGTCTLTTTNTALVVGADTIGIAYSGDANYTNPSGTGTLTISQNTVTGSISTSPLTGAAFGAPVVIKAIFAAASGSGAPTGSATIYDLAPGSGTPVSLGTVSVISGTATLTTSALIPGNHTLSASYGGDTNFAAILQVNGPTTALTINQGNTTVTLTPSSNPASLNQTITYNFTVQGGPTPPAGTITLTDSISGGGTIPTCNLVNLTVPGSGNSSNGSCTVLYNASNAIHGNGSHPITAAYVPTAGSTNWSAGTSPVLTEVVGKIGPTLSQPAASPTPGTYGVNLTYSVTLTPINPTPAYLSNTVQFYDNGTPLGGPQNVTAATGVASYGPVVPMGGSHTITAQFIGDTNYSASLISPNYVFSIGKATPTVTTLSPIPTSAPYVSQITLGQTTVANAGSAGVTPTGSVSLMAGSTTLATGTLDSAGHFTFTNVALPASLTVASYSLFVQYGGDGNFAATQSTSGTLNVTQTPSPVTVTSANIPPASASNPLFGQPLTFTATFAGPGNPDSGTTTFQDNGSNIAGCVGAVVSNNVATCNVNNLPVGSNIVTVSVLNGDTNHVLGAVTGTGTFQIVVDPTVTTLSSSTNPSQR